MVSFVDFSTTGGDFLIEGALGAAVLPDGVLADDLLAVCFVALGRSAPFFSFERV